MPNYRRGFIPGGGFFFTVQLPLERLRPSLVQRDLVLDLRDAWNRPCRSLGEIAFVPIVQFASERDRATVDVDRKLLRLKRRDTLEPRHVQRHCMW
jgi:hypothetical protein